MNTRS